MLDLTPVAGYRLPSTLPVPRSFLDPVPPMTPFRVLASRREMWPAPVCQVDQAVSMLVSVHLPTESLMTSLAFAVSCSLRVSTTNTT